MHILRIMVLWLVFSISSVLAQSDNSKQLIGDPHLKAQLLVEKQQVYENASNWLFLLTQDNVLNMPKAQNTDIRCGFIEDQARRLLATVMTDQGKYSAEYYLRNDSLLHVYDTFEYFEETAPAVSWRNFKGLAAWERRVYFNHGEAGYIEASGIEVSSPNHDGAQLQDRAQKLLKRIRASTQDKK